MIKRTILFAIVLFLTACSSQKDWTYSRVVSASPEFNSSMLRRHSQSELVGVGVELLKGSFGTLGYLNVSARKIPVLPGTTDTSIVVFVIEDEKFPYKANRMAGGQKLLLPEEATEQLVAALQNNSIVDIYLDGYMTKLEPSNFQKLYKKFH